MNKKEISRRDFLQTSTLLGAAGLIGGTALVSACGGKSRITPLREPGINGTLLYASSMADDVRVNLDKGCYLLQCGDVTKKIML